MSRMSPSRNPALVVLLYLGAVAACGEPQCPHGYVKKGDTCYRIKDGGAQSTDAVEGEDGAIAAGDEGGSPDDASLDAGSGAASPDASLDAGPEAGPRDVPDALVTDAATAVIDAGSPDAAPPLDGGGGSDAAAPDAGAVTCASQPCQNGGSCTDEPSGVRCSCPAPFMGMRCESRICTTMFLRTADDLAKARSCAEIQGNLSVTSAGIASITASDLPYLTKITGHFSMSGLANNGVETPRLRELTLAKLREIGGSLSVAQTGPGSVSEIHFPALTQVGGGVVFADTETRRLALPALRTVEGDFVLAGLKRLCTLEVDAMEQLSGNLNLGDLFNLPASALGPLRSALATTPTAENRIGCCLPIDSNCRESFTTEDRNAFCGCPSL